MTYVDGFVFIVKKEKISDYKRLAQRAGRLWKKHGALRYIECIGDDLNSKFVKLTFPKLTRVKKNETVWFSFVIYKNKAHRDRVNKKVMSDTTMSEWKDKPMPFDMKKMSYGGFRAVVDL